MAGDRTHTTAKDVVAAVEGAVETISGGLVMIRVGGGTKGETTKPGGSLVFGKDHSPPKPIGARVGITLHRGATALEPYKRRGVKGRKPKDIRIGSKVEPIEKVDGYFVSKSSSE